MIKLRNVLTPYATQVETEMQRLIPTLNEHRPFFGQIHYHLGWANANYDPEKHAGGKRVRAAFCLMVCEAFTGSIERALSAAAATEFLHEFTLIHDDIQDGDRSRRHRPTLWTIVGARQAINAGDGLFALAQQAMLHSHTRGVPAEIVLRTQQRFNEAMVHLCIGQHLDMDFEDRSAVTPEEYLTMIDGKTAALLAFAGEAGALMAGADERSILAFRQTGRAVGLAFQMLDDILGIWGDPAKTGKPVGADIRAKKKSFPVAYALSQPASEELRALYAAPIEQESQVLQARRLIETTGARDYVLRCANEQKEQAFEALAQVALPREAMKTIYQLVELLVTRSY